MMFPDKLLRRCNYIAYSQIEARNYRAQRGGMFQPPQPR